MIFQGREGVRLDKYLSEQLPQFSRTRIQAFIRAGQVRISGTVQKASYPLAPRESIQVSIPEEETPQLGVEPEAIPLEIIYEDEALVVINKPAGMVVHPGRGQRGGTLVNGLQYHFSTLSDVNGILRPGIVHRLDQDTSGLIIVAKTNLAHRRIAAQFESREIEKVYLGITWGSWPERTGQITAPIGRQRGDPTKFVATDRGREARTGYEVLHAGRYLSQLHFFPRTGRTHQIRVHAAHYGHPIFGDEKYGGGRGRAQGYLPEVTRRLTALVKSLNRQALHAQALKFRHPESGGELELEVGPPADIQSILTALEDFDD